MALKDRLITRDDLRRPPSGAKCCRRDVFSSSFSGTLLDVMNSDLITNQEKLWLLCHFFDMAPLRKLAASCLSVTVSANAISDKLTVTILEKHELYLKNQVSASELKALWNQELIDNTRVKDLMGVVADEDYRKGRVQAAAVNLCFGEKRQSLINSIFHSAEVSGFKGTLALGLQALNDHP